MEINDKKLVRTRKIINWTISITLGIFLILLSASIIDDLDSTVDMPQYEDFRDKKVEQKYDVEYEKIRNERDRINEIQSNYRSMLNAANEQKNAEQESFDNWIKTRNTIGDPSQDKEVLQRVKKLDEYRAIAQGWSAKIDSLSREETILTDQYDAIYSENQQSDGEASSRYESAMNTYDLTVFFIRLSFVAPILAIGIFFFIRFRKHKFAPLFMGFTIFSVYAFFVGLVPYLPSYGGYIRYTVGILITIGLGYYAIKRLRSYTEQRKAELQVSTTERAKKLQTDIAEKAFSNHVCPSCGKDFLLKPWEVNSRLDEKGMSIASDYCRHCGLQILTKCSKCGQKNYAHLPFCVSCGEDIKEQ